MHVGQQFCRIDVGPIASGRASSKQAGPLHLIMQCNRVEIEPVRPRQDALVNERAGEQGLITAGFDHHLPQLCRRSPAHLLDRSKSDGQPKRTTRLGRDDLDDRVGKLGISHRCRLRASPPRYPASAARIRAQLRVPLWKLVRSYFSFGECTRSSSSAKPPMIVSMPSTRLKSATIGIEPPSPTVTAFLPHSAPSAARVLMSVGLSNGSWIGGARPKLANSTLASAGSRLRTNLRKPSRTFLGSWVPTSRNDTFAVAWPGITVLAPSPV